MEHKDTRSGYFARIFSLAWVSNYSNEEEYVFCGGKYAVEMEPLTISHDEIQGNGFNVVVFFNKKSKETTYQTFINIFKKSSNINQST